MAGILRSPGKTSKSYGTRRVLLANPRGFCAGVQRAIDTVEQALTRHGAPVYVRRAIVHNRKVVEQLCKRSRKSPKAAL